jgi:hypothetical protein
MTLTLNRTARLRPTSEDLNTKLQEALNLIDDFRIRQRVLRTFNDLPGNKSLVLQNDFGFQVGGVIVVAANCISAPDTAFGSGAHWRQMGDGRLVVTILGLAASQKYKVTLEVIERG